MMKKIKAVFLTGVLTGLLIGCSNNEEIYTDISQQPIVSFNEEEDQTFWYFDGICKVDNGYYLFLDDLLYFCDDKSMQPVLLCTSPNCTHETEMCNAYFGVYGDELEKGFYTNILYVFNNNLYTIGYEISDVIDLYLYCISKDGTERDKVSYLSSLDSEYFIADYTAHKGFLYKVDDSEGKKCFIRYNMKNCKQECIMDLSDKVGAGMDSVYGYKNYVYFAANWFEDEAMSIQKNMIYRYNIDNGEIETVLEDFICNEFQLIDENTLLYYDLDYSIKRLDILTGEEYVIRETKGEYGLFSYDGTNVYYYDESGDCIEIYDVEGNEIDVIELDNMECYFGDENYLFAYSYLDNGEVGTYMYLDKKQIGTDNKDWNTLIFN